MEDPRLTYLLQQYIHKQCTPEEQRELAEMIIDDKYSAQLNAFMEASWDSMPITEELPAAAATNIMESILGASKQAYAPSVPVLSTSTTPRRLPWLRWAAAASIIVLLAAGAYTLTTTKPATAPAPLAATAPKDVLPPAASKAVITLANGETVALDSVGKGRLATQNEVAIVKLANGQVAYNGVAKELLYNTLSNPRGSDVVAITLADGTRVWLNAGSSLRYPVAFTGADRTVAVNGEAYFEVAHNAALPFRVTKGALTITVLGTHFNVNTYDDEQNARVTLLEGAVRLSAAGATGLLHPGQQAIVRDNISIVNDADLETVMAWKNGKFQFGEKADINAVMRELSRWYDLDITYKGDVSSHIGGSISRKVNVSMVLQMLEATGSVRFQVEGRHITVIPMSL
ncbi:MAG TPA: FecR domain-containing protein [Chitinophagaceae bacterium]|nr:FecR domain-containing protein [Chitinophagaceae bacterium]